MWHLQLPVCHRNKTVAPPRFELKFVAKAATLKPKRKTRMKDTELQRKERLATVLFIYLVPQSPAYQQVSQAGSLSTVKAVTQPAAKPNGPISFSGATGTGPSNAAKQRATVLHHFPSERPSRPQPLITRLCQSAAHKASNHSGLFTAFCCSSPPPHHHHHHPTLPSHYTAIIILGSLYAGEGFYFSFQGCRQKGQRMQRKITNEDQTSNSILLRDVPLLTVSSPFREHGPGFLGLTAERETFLKASCFFCTSSQCDPVTFLLQKLSSESLES